MFANGNLLRQALLLDAAASGSMGLVMAAAPGFVGGVLGLPTGFVLAIGVFFVIFALSLLALRSHPLPALVWLVVLGNFAWGVASIAILFTDLIVPNTFGIVVIVAQAIAVAVFAELELIGLRRQSPAVA